MRLDTLDPEKFAPITRWGRLAQVLRGLAAAPGRRPRGQDQHRGARKGVNEDEIEDILSWYGEQGFDLCLIETMPMGEIGADRVDQYLSASIVRAGLERDFGP